MGEPRARVQWKGEYGFTCPGRPGSGGCQSARDGKVKLWVNPEGDCFNCWVCGFRGNLSAIMTPGSDDQRAYLEWLECRTSVTEAIKPRCDRLPPEFIPLDRRAPATSAPYLSYLAGRGVDRPTVELYRMGYAETGRYRNRVIVPSFDRHGMVNLFSARAIRDESPTYRFPESSKNVVSNEHLVDWTQPVYLVEGIFDEVAVGPQGIALYGKFLPEAVATRLVQARPPMTFVCLDSDARAEALQLLRRLAAYDIPCAIVDLPGKDPGSLGGEAVRRAAATARHVTGSTDLVRAQVGL